MTQNKAQILIIGGGFGGLFTALDLKGAGEITLVNDEEHFLFKPMLYEYLSGEVEAWHIAPDCKELLDDRLRFIRGVVEKIDLEAPPVTLANRAAPLSYDLLEVAPGAVPTYAARPVPRRI